MKFNYDGKLLDIEIEKLIIAGWTGRDVEQRNKHIIELAEIGVTPPISTPCFYSVSKSMATNEPSIFVSSKYTSGEAEVFLIFHNNEIYVGVGSDHTDREVETSDVLLSKQCCHKPMSIDLWKYTDVYDHWDNLVLQSYIIYENEVVLYQNDTLSNLLHPEVILKKYEEEISSIESGFVMFLGTIPLETSLRYSDTFKVRLYDSVREKSLTHEYNVIAKLS
ncbi:DUF2848 family protein [Photobacterium ganghwense]|uniref:DUF2848 family protein n=1 Tax=Photobacterium ganghwense TaxID=320778 RepID=UPI001C2D9A41|nr:DUF2848 family protein [Photobacterium ganghwense]MBV1842725.1 DUF2848 domain-containing protein [Photobacterium ganghwense]